MSFDPTQPFSPPLLPPHPTIENAAFSELLLNARIELAELKGSSGQIPNPLLLTAPLLTRESVESSGIENINTTVAKVLENQLLPDDEQRAPDKEVLRYREALYWAAGKLPELSLSNRLILGIHEHLVHDRGGEYRREQNHIVNSKNGEILYTPPLQKDIQGLIANWEQYVNEYREHDPLIRAAIAHQQFESIHPFHDGNGRTGRILMVLQLVQDGVLDLPILFISNYINRNRNEYYEMLRNVSKTGEWIGYITFMLEGFYVQAKETKKTLKKITAYHDELKQTVKNSQPKLYSADLIDALFTYPIITPTRLAALLNMHYTTTSKHLQELAVAGILRSARVGRNHFFVNEKLVSLLSK